MNIILCASFVNITLTFVVYCYSEAYSAQFTEPAQYPLLSHVSASEVERLEQNNPKKNKKAKWP